jgi:putative membrane protein
MLSRRALLTCLAVASLAAGCRYFKPVNPTPSDTAGAAAEAFPAPGTPVAETPAPSVEPTAAPRRSSGSISDANIAAMVMASNNTDISYARLVPSRSARDDVKRFAQRMLIDHVGVNAMITELLLALDLAAEDNVESLDLRDESAEKRDIMRELSGFAFDSTYITNEISYHRKFLSSIDEVMLPRARNERLRNLLTSVRPAVAAHLAHAEQVWADVMAKK